MKQTRLFLMITRSLILPLCTGLFLCTGCLHREYPVGEDSSDSSQGADQLNSEHQTTAHFEYSQSEGSKSTNSSASAEQLLLESAEYRILLTSDTHYTYRSSWYETSPEDRMQHWVDSILEEHERRPFDLILILGDVSLDHWKWQGGGSYLKDGISTTELFVKNYVSQLPEDVPVRILAGNHEQYSNEQWKELTGNDRTCSFVLGNNLFIMPDSYSGELDPDYHHDGVYLPVDVDYIQDQMDAHPDHKVYLVSHYFNMGAESEEFKALLRDNNRIVTLFQGHTHKCSVISLGEDCGSKTILQCGNFSYSGNKESTQSIVDSFWGFRDLILTEKKAVSRYLMVESDAIVNKQQVHVNRSMIAVIPFSLKYYE